MNDLHSNFNNMKKISTYIRLLKKSVEHNKESVIVVDLGDNMDRMHKETEGTNGKVNVEVLNKLGVDVATIGNNEGLTFTKDNLNEIFQNIDYKMVVCNLKDIDTGNPPDWAHKYWIQELEGLTIGWIGATAPYETFYQLQGWRVENPIVKIKEIVEDIEERVDVIILLSHLGIGLDEAVAEKIPEIDIILGAHTHKVFANGIKKEKQPLICQVGIHGDYIGHLKLDYDFSLKKITCLEEETIPMAGFEDDPGIASIIENYREIAITELGVEVTKLDKPLPLSIDTESPLANLLVDGIKGWVDAEIGLVNTGQLLEGLMQGSVTKERLHEVCPSPINTCRVKLTGGQIKLILEQALIDEFIYSSIKGFGFRGKTLGTLSVSGISINYSLNNPDYQKIIGVYINETRLENDKEYIVGTIDMFTFGGGYKLVKEGKEIQYFLPEFLRDILELQLKDKVSIELAYKKRWISID